MRQEFEIVEERSGRESELDKRAGQERVARLVARAGPLRPNPGANARADGCCERGPRLL
jgi:hypothetical protein